MGSTSMSGGVQFAGPKRIQFTFHLLGVRYRPTLPWIPTEANLRRARQYLVGLKTRIAAGTFSFAEEFPEYRHMNRVPLAGSPRTCNQVFDDFLAHCAARVVKHDMAAVTLTTYRRVLDSVWRPELGALRFLDIRYSTLVEIADRTDWSKKSYNNATSVLRRAFKFGYLDYPERHDPARQLRSARIQRKDRPTIDPFRLAEAETLIAALRRDWGNAQANYDEFRFFTGLRPSEQIALLVGDFDLKRGTLIVSKARVDGQDKDSTKTGEDRVLALCPRAVATLRRHLALRVALGRAGRIDHDFLFFKSDGAPIRNLQYPYQRWRATLHRLPNVRYRKPYCARHTSVSWDLMIGRSPLWVARQHGHSIATMLRFYAAWAEGAPETEVEAIRLAMGAEQPAYERKTISSAPVTRSAALRRPLELEIPSPENNQSKRFASGFASGQSRRLTKCLNTRKKNWRRERDSNDYADQQLTEITIPFVPSLPLKSPNSPPNLPPTMRRGMNVAYL